ncbi:hypothetical protein GCM10011415_27540 [Salipiger pallidus]|uniref:Uncharacterized protein n=1 Tax=Salipiger pallidus TaxID=1775170 RepID=A0A8J2ZL80_9RHOB|nr:hypothetical protein GCM10011415_27540 [Salipiger pallidus]
MKHAARFRNEAPLFGRREEFCTAASVYSDKIVSADCNPPITCPCVEPQVNGSADCSQAAALCDALP